MSKEKVSALRRQVALDTETTGLDKKTNRIIEVGCVELLDRELTGRVLQHYVDPECDIEVRAQEVHGITREQLRGKPKFAEIADELLEFVDGAEVLIHNAAFDVGFLDRELKIAGYKEFSTYCTRVTDTLDLARQKYPGGSSLDQLCDQCGVNRKERDFHGARLDAELLAQVYLRLTGGQIGMTLPAGTRSTPRINSKALDIPVLKPSEQELQADQEFRSQMTASGEPVVAKA